MWSGVGGWEVVGRWDAEAILLVKVTPRCPALSSREPGWLAARIVDNKQADENDETTKRPDDQEAAAMEPLPRRLGPQETRD